ncbi:MAG: adenylate/guanylate cyclase domain-containing protein, partial [Stellaceae bacterium]
MFVGAAVWAAHPGKPGFRKGSVIKTFSQTLTFVVGLLYLEKRVSYRRLRKEFGLDDETLEDVRHELIVKRLAVDEGGQGLAFVGAALFETGDAPPPAFAPVATPIALPPVSPAPVAPAAIVAASEAERRQLTVMFCDLVGSTALSTGMDPEDLRDVIASYQNRCSAAIRHYDGFVAKFMGDGILVYFGYPRAHEDEAERSVRAGLDIVDAIAELNAAVPRPPGVELALRIGIASGPVIVGDQIGEGTASETA